MKNRNKFIVSILSLIIGLVFFSYFTTKAFAQCDPLKDGPFSPDKRICGSILAMDVPPATGNDGSVEVDLRVDASLTPGILNLFVGYVRWTNSLPPTSNEEIGRMITAFNGAAKVDGLCGVGFKLSTNTSHSLSCKGINSKLEGKYYMVLLWKEHSFSKFVVLDSKPFELKDTAITGQQIRNIKRLANGEYEITVMGGALSVDKFSLRVRGYSGSNKEQWPTSPYAYSCRSKPPSNIDFQYSSILSDKSARYEVICDFKNFPFPPPSGDTNYTLELLKHPLIGQSEFVDDAILALNPGKILSVVRVGNSINPNVFNVKVQLYQQLDSSIPGLALQVLGPDGGPVANKLCYLSATAPGEYTFTQCDLNGLMTGVSYPLVLYGVTTPNYIYIDETIVAIQENQFTNTCTCQVDKGSNCADANMSVTRNTCYVNNNPNLTCVSTGGLSCQCACVGSGPPPPPGKLPLLQYNQTNLANWIKIAQNIIISIGVISSVFILPYTVVLMASGNPENIQKGVEWAKSLAWGLLLLFLAGTIIRLTGTELLGLPL